MLVNENQILNNQLKGNQEKDYKFMFTDRLCRKKSKR